jgi:hypothetical protein
MSFPTLLSENTTRNPIPRGKKAIALMWTKEVLAKALRGVEKYKPFVQMPILPPASESSPAAGKFFTQRTALRSGLGVSVDRRGDAGGNGRRWNGKLCLEQLPLPEFGSGIKGAGVLEVWREDAAPTVKDAADSSRIFSCFADIDILVSLEDMNWLWSLISSSSKI